MDFGRDDFDRLSRIHSSPGLSSLLHQPHMMDVTIHHDSTDDETSSHGEEDEIPEDSGAQPAGRTLLPFPLAQAVTLTTRSASLFLRIGTSVGGYTFKTSKAATLSSFDLSRVMIEGILNRAGKDLLGANRTQFGRAETENILERGLSHIHRTITGAAFLTATGFQLIETTASNVHELTQLLLSFIDQLLGSTESSRAIASIFTLIRREFQNPATGVAGERVGIIDLFFGLCGLAYLQRWCKDLIEDENRRLDVDEVVWDVVVATTGERYDLHHESLYGVHSGRYTHQGDELQSGLDKSTNTAVMSAIQNHSAQQSSDEDDDLPEVHLKHQILQTLPDEAQVSITTETTTSKTITVDISGASPPSLSPPPGAKLIEHGPARTPRSTELISRRQDANTSGDPSSYRFVYRVDRNSFRTTDIHRRDQDVDMEDGQDTGGFVEDIDDSSDDAMDDDALELRPPVPPKSPVQTTNTSRIPQPGSKPPPPESANQKRQRAPLKPSSTASPVEQTSGIKPPSKKTKVTSDQPTSGIAKPASDKKTGLRNAIRKGAGPTLSGLLRKDSTEISTPSPVPRKVKTAPASPISHPVSSFTPAQATTKLPQPSSQAVVPGRTSSLIPSLIPKRDAPPPPNKSGNSPASKSGGSRNLATPEAGSRSHSRTSYVAVHERKRDSCVSQSDTYSIHTLDSSRPISPALLRSDLASNSGVAGARTQGSGAAMSKSRSEKDISDHNQLLTSASSSTSTSPGTRHHRRARSQNPSIYTLKTSDSQTSLVLSSYFTRSAYSDSDALNGLRRSGMVQGMFPKGHLLRNITRYMLFSSASYGSSFLKVMGISKKMTLLQELNEDTHHELKSYAHHTDSEANSILLSSFVDPQGGSDSTGSVNTGVPLVHYISVDKENQAVVLACRGTLGFEDVLADMTCDYDDLLWRGRSYKVHKGIHASARRLLYGGDGRVLATLKAALEEYPDYGLVLCGHSLGGSVTALLGVMLSEPNSLPTGTAFVTSASSCNTTSASERTTHNLCLPPGRPIHVYAYGPPGTMSASLRKATRGLITSVVQGNDLVPHLSLGVLHDLQAVALAIKNDNIDAKMEVRQRLWAAFQDGLARSWYSNSSSRSSGCDKKPAPSGQLGHGEDDTWAFAALKTLRANMMSMKLLPPGEVFTVESTQVLRRDAFVGEGGASSEAASGSEGFFVGRPARRVVLKYVRDVEARFREVRFAGTMLTDHSPGRYEDALNLLSQGVMTH